MKEHLAWILLVGWVAALAAAAEPTHWEWCGWGGGGYMWATAYHPTKPGVIYLGGDCAGCYKTEDDGQHWRFINNGLIDYAVYGLAVDTKSPDTVYALTEAGTCKSTDAGEHWTNLPDTAKGKLGILADRHVSVRPLAVDPTDSRIVYAATPRGQIYKSEDGAQTWKEVFQLPATEFMPTDALRAEFPAGAPFGAFFFLFTAPAAECKGFGFTFKANGTAPKNAFVTLWGPDGVVYRSKNLNTLFEKIEWQDVALNADDFIIDPDKARENKEKAPAWPKQPDWKTITRMDFTCAGLGKKTVVHMRTFYFVLPDAQKAVVKDFATDKKCITYGSISTAAPKGGAFASISVARKNPQWILAASPDRGVFLSKDAGKSWEQLNTPKSARYAVADPNDPDILYGAFDADGVYKSVDAGKTWTAINDGIKKDCKIAEIAISPASSSEAVCIGEIDWGGYAYWTDNGGRKWNPSPRLQDDPAANPAALVSGLSRPTNISYCPSDPKKLYVSGNWRPAFSDDGGRTWTERDRGADISCVYDVRFSQKRVYTACMDEGVFFSDDAGTRWHNPWPRGRDASKIAGHYWRLFIADNNGADRIVSTCSPWVPTTPNRVVLSEDGGQSFTIVTNSGLLTYKPTANTMWGQSFARALAADPKDPRTLYLGMDGDPTPGKPGGGIFKSSDGGYTWKQLPHQPGSRRMFAGLAVDPTDSKRLYWGACGTGGGLYRSEDGGDSWERVMKTETWVFNVLVAADGTVYCPGKDLWRSTDHGKSWKKLTRETEGQIVGLEVHPSDPKTLWYSSIKHGGTAWGHIMKTADGGATWQDITGDIGYRKPMVLRFNPATDELWAGGVGLFKTKQ